LAEVVFGIDAADEAIFGRSPLCHQSTTTLAM
jgi:hypothetical protein